MPTTYQQCSIHEDFKQWPYRRQCAEKGSYDYPIGMYAIKVCNRHLTMLREQRG